MNKYQRVINQIARDDMKTAGAVSFAKNRRNWREAIRETGFTKDYKELKSFKNFNRALLNAANTGDLFSLNDILGIGGLF